MLKEMCSCADRPPCIADQQQGCTTTSNRPIFTPIGSSTANKHVNSKPICEMCIFSISLSPKQLNASHATNAEPKKTRSCRYGHATAG